MAWNCEQCRETTTVGEVLNVVTKLALFGAVAYIAFNYRSDLKAIVEQTVKKTKANLSGRPKKKK